MLSVVLLSVGAAFAADNATDVVAIDDEVTVDEPLAVGGDAQPVSANESTAVVTKDNFNSYFDENGTLLSNVTSDELKFSGDISDVGVSAIGITRPIAISGDNAVFNNVSIDVFASDVVISGLTINQDTSGFAIAVYNATNVEIKDSTINFNAIKDYNAFAIDADNADNLKIMNNIINYAGATTGWNFNYAIQVTNSNNAIINGNKIKAKVISADVGWEEVPPGSKNWVSTPISGTIVVKDSNGVVLDSNDIDTTYSAFMGSYDTIYAVDFSRTSGTVITNNNITSTGKSYIYGIIISDDDFTIRGNNIKSTAEYYANGVDVEGPAAGVVEDNVIDVKSGSSAYGIYSGMNGADVNANYTGNEITGEAYNIFGFSIGDVSSNVVNNTVLINGNYTTGMAYRVTSLSATGNRIVLTSSEKGNESIWEGFGVEAVGIKVIKGAANIADNVIAGPGKGVSFTGNQTNVVLKDNMINTVANDDKDAYAIYANDSAVLEIVDNNIDYQGATKGIGINNAVYLYETDGAVIKGNKFDLDLVSCYVPWAEVPSGSGNWVSFPISEGIVVESSNNVTLDNNTVNVQYTDVVGSYDTIYSVVFKNSNNSVISKNTIVSNGNTYIYGLQITGDNFNINSNDINTTSNYYSNGIDIEGPASGVVKENGISVISPTSAYGIYSGMNGADVKANYIGNDITGDAYNIFGFSLGDVESNVIDNDVILSGNYTTGIAYRGSNLVVDNTKISAKGSNVGNESIWEGFGVQNIGIKVVKGTSTITNNNIQTTGDSTINLTGNVATVKDNYLRSANNVGAFTIVEADNATISGNDPKVKTKIVVASSKTLYLTVIKKGYYYQIKLVDANNNPLAKKIVSINFDGKTRAYPTNALGVIKYKLSASKIGTKKMTIKFAGDEYYAAKTATATIKVIKQPTKLSAASKAFRSNVKVKKYVATLKDNKNKVIKKAKLTLRVNGKTFKATTNAKGQAIFKITKLTKKASYKAVVKFAGNGYYKAASKNVKIVVR